MVTRTISLQLEEDISTNMAAAFIRQISVFKSTIRLIAGNQCKKSARNCFLRPA